MLQDELLVRWNRTYAHAVELLVRWNRTYAVER